jgi:hypothetical protein
MRTSIGGYKIDAVGTRPVEEVPSVAKMAARAMAENIEEEALGRSSSQGMV